MLEYYFTKATRLRQLRRGPFGPHIDALASELRQAGYTATSAPNILTYAGKFSAFAHGSGIADASQIDEPLVKRFLEDLVVEGAFTGAANAMRHVLGHLRRAGVIAAAKTAVCQDAFEVLLGRYNAHLRDVQGLQASTREGYLRGARKLLEWQSDRSGEKAIGKLSGADVLTFVTELLEERHGAAWRGHVCSQTRIFLRYLGGTGIVTSGLDRAVPRAARHRLSNVPRHLPWEQVRALIDSVDTTHPSGMRDKAVLLVLATLGLRNAEVRRLELSHVAWRAGEIRLPRTKGCKERVLPMPQELGVALADYVLHGRPVIDVPQVFLRHKAPLGPLTASGAVATIVAFHLRRTGISAATRGAHLLRHSLATRMVNVGVPIKTIADVLGHASIDTTAIYTKVDTTRLALAALPFPGARCDA